VKQQFIAGAGGELDAPGGQSGNMYAVYSSSALCVNLFHYWFRLLDAAPPNSKLSIDPLLRACGLPARPAKSVDFEVPNVVNGCPGSMDRKTGTRSRDICRVSVFL
jgi:hypothetical protein